MGRPKSRSRNAAARLVRREEAEARQAARADRTPEQQIALLNTRPGNATKERILLGKLIKKP